MHDDIGSTPDDSEASDAGTNAGSSAESQTASTEQSVSPSIEGSDDQSSSPRQTSTDLPLEETFDILSNYRRRMVLYYIRDHDGDVSLNDLALQIAAWENETDIEDVQSQERKRVYVSLYQTHLPKLSDSGVVGYDVDDGTVRATELTASVNSFLTMEQAWSFPMARHYKALGAIAAVVLSLGAAGVGLFGSMIGVWLTIGFLGGIGASLAIAWYDAPNEDAEDGNESSKVNAPAADVTERTD